MSDIYDQHKAAFAAVSAYVVLNGSNERVATIAFKFPRDGAGRLYCYLHVFGTQMVRGHAAGYGYDKRSAAIHVAARNISEAGLWDQSEQAREAVKVFKRALTDRGLDWSRELENAGFSVLQAV